MITKYLELLLGMVACTHLTTAIPLVCFTCAYIFIRLMFSAFWFIPLLYLAWWIYDRDTPYKKGRPFFFMRNLFLWKYMAKYFPATLHKTADLDPSKNYLFAFHPHGLVVFGAFIHFGTNATGFDEKFPGINVQLLTVNLQFRFPFFRDYVLAAGLGSVGSESIDYKLTQLGPGHSVLIAVGGAAETMLMESSKYTLKLANRKGFIRKALKTGASVVPVISFNEHRLFDVTYAKEGEFMYYVQKIFRYFYNIDVPKNGQGRPGFWYFVPKEVPINTVVGAPIDFNELKSFNKGQDPPEELVTECHKIYLEAYRNLYDDHKARFGDKDTPLIFV